MITTFDITFCLSDSCPKSKKCQRNYTTLKSIGIKFDMPISMATFYNKDKTCNYFIQLDKK